MSYVLTSTRGASPAKSVGTRIDPRLALLACVRCDSFHSASFELVAQIAQVLDCDRVSLGVVRGTYCRLQAISGLSQFDRRMRLARQIEAAMDEAVEQTSPVASIKCDDDTLIRQQQVLLAGQHRYCLSIPVCDASGVVGALTVEKNSSENLSPSAIKWLQSVSNLAAGVLRLHQRGEQSWSSRLRSDLKSFCSEYLAQPLNLQAHKKAAITLSVLVFLLAANLLQGEYRVTANALIEGADKQVLVAPYAGYIQAANARSGDAVEAGQILASIDTNALLVEKEKWLSELSKLDKSYALALAQGDRIELSLANALREELNAELQLVNQRLQRSQIAAPYRGVVVSGDLNQLLGAPVEQGQVLFELASMDQFRLMLDVNESAIADIQHGQNLTVRLSSMPGITHESVLTALQPVAVSVAGKNVFRVEAELPGASQQFRPGMRGVAKIVAGERSYFWLWTHALVNRIRVWLWSFGLLS